MAPQRVPLSAEKGNRTRLSDLPQSLHSIESLCTLVVLVGMLRLSTELDLMVVKGCLATASLRKVFLSAFIL
jgi:hypothetical protein